MAQEQQEKQEKKKKEKIIYYDDNSTIVDMTSVNKKGEKKAPPPPRVPSTAREKWNTYWNAVKSMVIPMFIALGILGVFYLLMMWIGGNL